MSKYIDIEDPEIIIDTNSSDYTICKVPSSYIPITESKQLFRAHWYINPDGYYPQCSHCYSEPPGREMTDYCPTCGYFMKG